MTFQTYTICNAQQSHEYYYPIPTPTLHVLHYTLHTML